MEHLFADLPEAVENTALVAERLEFTLENLGYEFPKYPVPPGETMDSFLRTVAFAGARARYSHLSAKVLRQLNFELDLILPSRLFRLLSHCLGHRELLQPKRHFYAGRGSAANSVVCYSLGITACDPIASNLSSNASLAKAERHGPTSIWTSPAATVASA